MRPVPHSAPRAAWLAALVPLFLVAGCGKKAAPTPVALQGRVELADGKVPARLVLVFHPQDDHNRDHTPSAAVSEGHFQVRCLPGRYKVCVAPLSADGGVNPAGGPLAPAGPAATWVVGDVPAAYLDPAGSPWDVLIPEGGKDDLVLTVK